jgi:hypothetical protein
MIFLRQVFFCVRKVGFALFMLTLITTSLDQLITDHMQAELMSPHGASPTVWLWGISSMALNLVMPLIGLLITLAVLAKNPENSWWKFLRQNLNQNLIEAFRSWGKALSWSFALILPGLIRFFQYLLVPFVVCFDPEYRAGHRDALETSRALSRGRLLSLVGVFFAFSILVPLVLTSFDSKQLLWKTPVAACLLCFVEMLSNICFIVALSQIYDSQVAANN